MKRTKTYNWLPLSLFQKANPLNAIILGIESTEDDTLLKLSIEKEIYQMSLWGKNMNVLIDKFGDDDEKWLGKSIQLQRIKDMVDNKDKTLIS
jgi:hypothetical protein